MKRTFSFAVTLGFIGAACAGPPADRPEARVVQIPADTVEVVAFGPGFGDARSVAADPRGVLYVTDAATDVVYRFPADAEPRAPLGGPGSGDYAFLTPTGLDPTNGLTLYVADAGNGRIQRFSHEDRLLETLRVPSDPEPWLGRRVQDGDPGRPVAVAAAPSGEIFVVETRRGAVLMWDDRRSLARIIGTPGDGRGALRRPVDLALAHDGRLLVADAGHAAVLVYDAYGEFLRRLADGIALDVRAVIAEQNRIGVVLPDKVLLYDLEGMLQQSLAVDVPEPILSATFLDGELLLLTRSRLWRVLR